MKYKNQKNSAESLIFITFFAICTAFVFCLAATGSFQSNVKNANASAAEPADFNNDNVVDIFDLSALLSRWSATDALYDINNDGTVNIFDLSILLSKWGAVQVSLPIWKGDYETGNLNQFVANNTWDFYPTGASASVVASSSVSPAGAGGYIGKYYVPSGAGATGSSVRAESIIDPGYNFTRNQDLWFSFSTYLGADMPMATSNWQTIAQWKNHLYGSPPISLSISDGTFRIDGGYGYPGSVSDPNYTEQSHLYSQDVAPASVSQWHSWLFHIYFSDDPSLGYIEAWHNGQQVNWDPYIVPPYTKVVSGTKFYPPGGTLYPNTYSYLKLGIYRSSSILQSSTIYHDNWKIGTTRQSVQ